jgi:hypothetical protein
VPPFFLKKNQDETLEDNKLIKYDILPRSAEMYREFFNAASIKSGKKCSKMVFNNDTVDN